MHRLTFVVVILILAAPAAGAVHTKVPKLADCGRAAVRPPTIVLRCADTAFSFSISQWSWWRSDAAAGEGTAWRNSCKPDCGAGRFVSWRVSVRLYRPHFCRRWNRVLFTRLAWRAVGPVPTPLAKTGRKGVLRLPLLHLCP